MITTMTGFTPMMMRRFVLVFSLLAGCGPAFESEAVELEYLDSLSNPTREQFLRRKELHAEAELAQQGRIMRRRELLQESERVRKAEEERRRNTPEAKAKAEAEAKAIAAERVRIAEADRRKDEAADALATEYRAAVAKGNTPEALRAAYQSIVDRYPGTESATIARYRLDELGTP